MSLTPLNAISPIDGRYRSKTNALADYFSEEALIKYRVFVEIELVHHAELLVIQLLLWALVRLGIAVDFHHESLPEIIRVPADDRILADRGWLGIRAGFGQGFGFRNVGCGSSFGRI